MQRALDTRGKALLAAIPCIAFHVPSRGTLTVSDDANWSLTWSYTTVSPIISSLGTGTCGDTATPKNVAYIVVLPYGKASHELVVQARRLLILRLSFTSISVLG